MSFKCNRHKFWMCLVDPQPSGVRGIGCSRQSFEINEAIAPKVIHYDKEIATKEAEKLAKKTGQDVFLISAVSFVRWVPPVPPPELVWKDTVGHC